MGYMRALQCFICSVQGEHSSSQLLQDLQMTDQNDRFTITPLGQSVFFAYVDAYAKKHNITRDEAVDRLSKGDGGTFDDE